MSPKTVQELASYDDQFKRLCKAATRSASRLYKMQVALRNEKRRYRKSHDVVTAYFKAARRAK